MDLNLVVTNSVSSLQNLCAISLSSYLLLDKNINPDHSENYASALTCIDALHYPSVLKKILSHHLLEIYNNVIDWTGSFGRGHFEKFRPVMSISGTVDCYSTAKRIVDDKKIGRFERFVVACIFCFEESIFQIGGQMSKEELDKVKYNLTSASNYYYLSGYDHLSFTLPCKREHGCVLDNFLSPVTDVWFRSVLDGGRDYLTHQECKTSLNLALQLGNGYVIKFFAEKLSSEDCAGYILMNSHFDSIAGAIQHIEKRNDDQYSSDKRMQFQLMKPETYTLLLSKLDSTNQQRLMPVFALLVLNSIVSLPNSDIFKRALPFLDPYLIPQTYWILVLQTLKKFRLSMTRHEHMEILDVLWDLVANFENISLELRQILNHCSLLIGFRANNARNSIISSQIFIEHWKPLLHKYLSKIHQLLEGLV